MPSIELVIVDGGSTDGSWEYANEFLKYDNVSLIRQYSPVYMAHSMTELN